MDWGVVSANMSPACHTMDSVSQKREGEKEILKNRAIKIAINFISILHWEQISLGWIQYSLACRHLPGFILHSVPPRYSICFSACLLYILGVYKRATTFRTKCIFLTCSFMPQRAAKYRVPYFLAYRPLSESMLYILACLQVLKL